MKIKLSPSKSQKENITEEKKINPRTPIWKREKEDPKGQENIKENRSWVRKGN